MQKSYKKSNKRKTSKKTPKSSNKIQCCMCRKNTLKNKVLETTRCRITGPFYKPPICHDCWWGTKSKPGFAEVSGSHICPGCKKGLSPVRIPPPKSPPKIIDLTGSP